MEKKGFEWSPSPPPLPPAVPPPPAPTDAEKEKDARREPNANTAVQIEQTFGNVSQYTQPNYAHAEERVMGNYKKHQVQ